MTHKTDIMLADFVKKTKQPVPVIAQRMGITRGRVYQMLQGKEQIFIEKGALNGDKPIIWYAKRYGSLMKKAG